MPEVRWPRVGRLLVLAGFALVGCAGNVGSGDPAPEGSAATESAARTVTTQETRRTLDGDPCSPLACCFPTEGGGWQDNALEDRLQALGCGTPAPYAENGGNLWVWTRCPFDLGVIETTFKYAGTPYDARLVENPCLGFEPGTVDVVFDPTCPTCISLE
jgi:hypothetical protein